jgi:hypothetical protein
LHDSYKDSETNLDEIRKELMVEQISLNAELFAKHIRHLRKVNTMTHQEAKLFYSNAIKRVYPLNMESAYLLFNEMNKLLYAIMENNSIINIDVKDIIISSFNEEPAMLESYKFFSLVVDKPMFDDITEVYLLHLLPPVDKAIYVEFQVELTRFIRQYGDWSSLAYTRMKALQEQILHSYKKRLPATLVIEMLKLAYETGDQKTRKYFDQSYHSYLKEMVDPEMWISAELAIELAKLAHEQSDQNALDYFLRYLHRKVKEREEVNSELVIEVIKLAREVSDQKTLTIFLNEYVHTIINYRSIPIQLLIELLKIAKNDSYQVLLQDLKNYCEKLLTEKRYLPHELAVAMIQFAHKVDNNDILNYFNRNYLKDMLQAQQLVPVELAVELVKLAQASNTYDQASIESFYHKNINVERCYLDVLPIDTIVSLRRLAQGFHDDELLRKIEQKMGL